MCVIVCSVCAAFAPDVPSVPSRSPSAFRVRFGTIIVMRFTLLAAVFYCSGKVNVLNTDISYSLRRQSVIIAVKL